MATNAARYGHIYPHSDSGASYTQNLEDFVSISQPLRAYWPFRRGCRGVGFGVLRSTPGRHHPAPS